MTDSKNKSVKPQQSGNRGVLERDFQPPIYAIYSHDGKLKLQVTPDKNHRCMGLPLVELENTANLLARLALARKGGLGDEEILAKLNTSLSILVEMKPRDSVEAMMITQMIAVHEMALSASERALITEQPDEFVGKNINRAAKLFRTFASLVEALTKYRNKGRQKITVQHVNVNDGGQAIVGDVTQGGGNG
jgi:hypothetical protein